MISKSIKMGVLVLVGAALVGGLFFGKDMISYAHSSCKSVQTAVKDSVPIEFELKRAHDLLQDVIPEMHANIKLISQEEVEIAALQADIGQSTIDETPASGGVLATPGSTYTYYSGSLLASSLLKEGDVTILSARYSDSDNSKVTSLTVDSRYPFGRTWRVNLRLRVDRRQLMNDGSEEWMFTPGVRIQYRRSQKFRIELETGKLFSQRDSEFANQDRESYFVNIGYQAFF